MSGMIEYAIRVVLTALIVVAVAEIAKRNPLWAAILASLPLTSLLAFIWLYVDTGALGQITILSRSIFWLVLPSLVLFLALPALLDRGMGFWVSLFLACVATSATDIVTAVSGEIRNENRVTIASRTTRTNMILKYLLIIVRPLFP